MKELISVKGIGKKTLAVLNKNGIFTCRSLFQYLPTNYHSTYFSDTPSFKTYHYLKVQPTGNAKVVKLRDKLTLITFKGMLNHKHYEFKAYNQQFLVRLINSGSTLVVFGKQTSDQLIVCGKIMLASSFQEGIHPKYGLEGIPDKTMQKLAKATQVTMSETLPESLIKKHRLLDIMAFHEKAHWPKNTSDLHAVKTRMKYEELLIYQLQVQLKRYARINEKKLKKDIDESYIKGVIETLPYQLTDDQHHALDAILNDLSKTTPMHRLLQGETGSGKTIIAFLAALAVIKAGYQVALMAPTSILAEQHYTTFQTLLAKYKISCQCLLGSTQTSRRKEILETLATGTLNIVIGTHALFSENVHYHNLGLVITDEQHRFGVAARRRLSLKAKNPDILHLSATPIPRTLAMTLFNDMDISTLTQKPLKENNVRTHIVSTTDRQWIRESILNTLNKKQQIFIVVPFIEPSELMDIPGIETIYEVIKKRYPSYKVAYLHGQQNEDTKQNILRKFKAHDINILVSTTVIEVGIHVPNATLMIVYHAERFGLAQIHQLRGRVGRGHHEGICLLITDQHASQERLNILEKVHDGFTLSEYDLKQRGYGDVAGTMQSGYIRFKHMDGNNDIEWLKIAKDDAQIIVKAYHQTGAHQTLLKKASHIDKKE